MTKAAAIILTIFLLVVGSLVGFAVFQPSAPRPSVSLVFLGYTNNHTGIRLAAFSLKNEGASPVERRSRHWIQIPSPAPRGTRISEGWLPGQPFLLGPGASEMLTIIAPTNQATWKFAIVVGPHNGFLRDIADSVSSLSRS